MIMLIQNFKYLNSFIPDFWGLCDAIWSLMLSKTIQPQVLVEQLFCVDIKFYTGMLFFVSS